jgi:nitrogen fixation/metabolism regulation signal transduction histidine kinase
LRVLVTVMPPGLGVETRILQLVEPVPSALALNADSVQTVYADYQELSLGREGLTRIYAMTLTLTVLLALFTAIASGFRTGSSPVGTAVDPCRGDPGRGRRRLHPQAGGL